MKKRTIVSLLCAIVLLAGCGESGGGLTQKTQAGENGKITAEPLELTAHMHWQNVNSFKDDFAIFQEAFKLTNVRLKGTAASTNSNSAEAYNLMIASGDIPDIIGYIDYNRMMSDAQEGLYLPLNELIEQYAPNIKAFFDANPDVRKSMTAADGQIYGLPSTYDKGSTAGMGYMIRQDWLDKLNLSMPQTVDEFYTVLKAFRENDPNGNGQKDEVPFLTRTKGSLPMVSFWNAKPGYYVDNGTVKYGPVEPEYKEAMMNVAKYYAEGLIDQEIFSRGANAREVLFGEDKGGMTYDWFSSTSAFNDQLPASIPGFKLVGMEPPASADGVRRCDFKREPLNNKMGWGISNANQYPVETIKYMDFWFSEAGKRLYNFGIEGEDYNLVDGKPIFTDKVLKNEQTPALYLNSLGSLIPVMGAQTDAEYEKQAMQPEGLDALMLYENNDNYNYYEKFPLVPIPDESKEQFARISNDMNTKMNEIIQKWVIGVEPLDDASWERYLADMKNIGVEDAVRIQQQAYDEYQAR